MLKIKEDVDLKELEKFGFVKKHTEFYRDIYGVFGYRGAKKIIVIDRREIWIYNEEGVDILYDLITAGLVEKVVEE